MIAFLQHFNEHIGVHEIKALLASFEQRADYQFCFLFYQSSKRVCLPSDTHSHFPLQFGKMLYGTLCVRKQVQQPDEPAFPMRLSLSWLVLEKRRQNLMKQSTFQQLWFFLFIAILVLTCAAVVQVVLGHGSIAGVLGLLAVLSFTTAQVFKKASILLWAIALILVVVAFFVALQGMKF